MVFKQVMNIYGMYMTAYDTIAYYSYDYVIGQYVVQCFDYAA